MAAWERLCAWCWVLALKSTVANSFLSCLSQASALPLVMRWSGWIRRNEVYFVEHEYDFLVAWHPEDLCFDEFAPARLRVPCVQDFQYDVCWLGTSRGWMLPRWPSSLAGGTSWLLGWYRHSNVTNLCISYFLNQLLILYLFELETLRLHRAFLEVHFVVAHLLITQGWRLHSSATCWFAHSCSLSSSSKS